MTNLKGYRIIDRLVMELNMSEHIFIVSYPFDYAIDHLLYILEMRDREIKDCDLFYKKN